SDVCSSYPLEDEMFDELTVMARQIVLEQQQDLAGVGEFPGQARLRRLPVMSTEKGEVLAPVERHIVVGEPDVLGAEVAVHVRFDDRFEFQGQRVSDRFLCHAVTVTNGYRFVKSPGPCRDPGFSPSGYRSTKDQSSS